jgi:hypothetical protein
MPFWSSRARAVRATRTEVYQGFEVFEVRWDEFVDRWIDGLTRDGLLVGVNWTGDRLTGYDVAPADLPRNVDAATRQAQVTP